MPEREHQWQPLKPRESRVQVLASQTEHILRQSTDRMFAVLLVFQWFVEIALACWLSPKAWVGPASSVHLHLWAAIVLGGAIIALPLLLIWIRPGQKPTRHVIAVAQMLSSALLIHLTGGRLETHFHIFGSLAFLSFYRDWRVLVTASIIATCDHFIRGLYWPESIYGIASGAEWRWLEHAGWVAFLDIFLFYACWQHRKRTYSMAERQALLETVNETVEREVMARTKELHESECRFKTLASCSAAGIFQTDALGRYVYVNDRFCAVASLTQQEAIGCRWTDTLHPDDCDRVVEEWERAVASGGEFVAEFRFRIAEGKVSWVLASAVSLRDGGEMITGHLGTVIDITERRLREEVYHEAQQRLHSAFDAAAIGMALVAPDGRWLQVNQALCEIVGYSSEELLCQTFQDITHPDDLQTDLTYLRQMLAETIHTYQMEKRYRHKNGHFVWTLLNVTLVCDRSDAPLYFIAQIQDISQRKLAECERDRFFNQPLDLMCIGGFDGKFRRLNLAWEERFGFSRDELMARSFLDIVFPEDRPAVIAEVDKMAAGEVALSFECRLLCKRSGFRWILWNATPSLEEQAFYATGHDITERKQSEQALAELSQLQQAILDHSAYAITAVTPEGIVQMLNPACERMFGYTAAELVGRLSLGIFHLPEEVAARAEELSRELGEPIEAGMEVLVAKARRKLPNEQQWTGVRKDGSRFPQLLSVTAMNGTDGRISGFIGIASDITARRQAEECLNNTLRSLEEARRQADAANRAKSEFLANMSHEIRTPMNGILGLTELLMDTDLSVEQRDSLEMVNYSADSLMTLINDILDFSKIEAGKIDLELVEFRLHDLLEDTLKPLALRAHHKGLELSCDIGADVPELVVADQGRLRQILINLVGNAIKFTELGEVIVRAESRTQPDGIRYVRFSVTDTGIGIPLDKQRIIFDPFSQADGSTTRHFGGTGLGLTISSRLVALMSGQLKVESEIGLGSTFYFDLCLGKPKGSSSEPPLKTVANLQGLAVLVVDDNATNRRILDGLLCKWGARPISVDGGPAALAELRRAAAAGEAYPLLLVDAMMPEMDGFSLIEHIRDEPGLAPPTIMMLSSADHQGDSTKCRNLGMASYLVKPVKSAELQTAISIALSGKPKQPRVAPRRPIVTATPSRPLRILLAEDNVVNQRVATRILNKQGYATTVVGNGRQALAALKQGPFDLVLMDIQMPEMDGFEATQAIRLAETTTGKHLSVVAMTAHAMKGDRERCLEAGMDDYISKPIKSADLLRVIQSLAETVSSADDPIASSCETQQVFNRGAALECVDGDEDVLFEMIGLFLENTPRRMDEIRRAVEQGDVTCLFTAAHSLKGAIGYLGAAPASAAAMQVEELASHGDLQGATDALKSLEREIECLTAEVSQHAVHATA